MYSQTENLTIVANDEQVVLLVNSWEKEVKKPYEKKPFDLLEEVLFNLGYRGKIAISVGNNQSNHSRYGSEVVFDLFMVESPKAELNGTKESIILGTMHSMYGGQNAYFIKLTKSHEMYRVLYQVTDKSKENKSGEIIANKNLKLMGPAKYD